MKTLSESRAFGGVQGVYSHASEATGTEMTFGLFLPETIRFTRHAYSRPRLTQKVEKVAG